MCAAFKTKREKHGGGRLIKQGEPTSHHQHVKRRLAQQRQMGCRDIAATADGPDHALRSEVRKRGQRAVKRGPEMRVAIMDKGNVQPVDPQPPQALLDRAQRGVAAVVVPVAGIVLGIGDGGGIVAVTPDLGRQHKGALPSCFGFILESHLS